MPAAFTPTPFARSLTKHACEWRERHDGSRQPILRSWLDGIHPAFKHAAHAAVEAEAVRLHDYSAAVTSSQAFAINLFIPFREVPRESLAARVGAVLGVSLVIERISFEWTPPGALLGEIEGDRPNRGEPATSVDVVLWCRVAQEPVAVLLEVKLSEGGFTPCGGRESRSNRRRDVCESALKFFDDPSACYLRRPRHQSRDRRYWSIFTAADGSVRGAFPGAPLDGPCPFAADAQQPMRNLAIARALAQEGLVAHSWFGLCAHDENPEVARHWGAWRSLLPDPSMAPIVPASLVLAAGRDAGLADWAAWMSDRYRLRIAE